MKTPIFWIISTLGLLSSYQTLAAPAAPAAYISACFDCHGQQGVSTEKDVPTIAGLSAAFIESSMFAYKDNVRPAKISQYYAGDLTRAKTDMKKLSDGLTEKQITAIADYFAEQKFVPASQAFDAELAALGKRIHQMKCAKCHEDGGTVADDDAGILSGQWLPYLKQTFIDYRDKSRPMDKKMTPLVVDLSDQEVDALLNYYASNKP